MSRARAFYEGVLGLAPSMAHADGDFAWTEYDIGGAALALGCGSAMTKPSVDGGSVGLEVADFSEAIAKLKADKVAFVMEAAETPVCHLAIIKDPDGNAVIIHKRKA